MDQKPLNPVLNSDTAELIKSIIKEMREPSDKEKEADARKLRDRKAMLKQQNDMRRMQLARQDNCSHQRKDGSYDIVPTHNWPDNIVRGICQMCQDIIIPGDPDYAKVAIASQA